MPNYKTTYVGKDTDIDKVIEIFGGLLHQLNYIMNNMDSQNVKRINTNSTVIKSADGATEIDGSQLVMYDERNKKRLLMGKNKNGRFEFILYDQNERESLKFDGNTGNATFSGDIAGSTITGSDINGGTINVESDIKVGNNVYIGDRNDTNVTKSIRFFDPEGGNVPSNKKGLIEVIKENNLSQTTTLNIKSNTIYLLAPEGVKAGVTSDTASDIVTSGSIGRAYVEIGGTEYQVQWR